MKLSSIELATIGSNHVFDVLELDIRCKGERSDEMTRPASSKSLHFAPHDSESRSSNSAIFAFSSLKPPQE